ncbi:uncharacterized protein LOC128202209 [Galleria mellonella]|uniref:Uncharacterized protein LOC128202209 n=1 Tax=Galleria mellonella TaxID=7137 RepID=A0ABM3N1Z1_GALME|nr:uncharacterized protein LOC128202209 [Galleria mellonella]
MAPTTIKCAGCRNVITSKEYLNCSNCKQKYDIECVNIASKYFYSMSKDIKSIWKCPECQNKIPKSDNSNTPVRCPRSDLPTSHVVMESTSTIDNITTRSKKQRRSSDSSDEGCLITEDKLKRMLQKELNSILRSTIREMITEQLNNINQQLTNYQNSVSFLNEQFEVVRKGIENNVTTIAKLEKENAELKTTARDLSSRLCLAEQHLRESNIEIGGLVEHRSEHLPNTVVQLAKIVGSPIEDVDVMQAVRVAKINKNSDKPRSVVAKFRSPRIRDAILAAVIRYNKANPNDKLSSQHLGLGGPRVPIFISEHLTPSNKQLHAATRKKAKDLGYRFVWIRNGRIYVRKDESCQALLVRNYDSLNLMM